MRCAEREAPSTPLYERLLGPDWGRLPTPIQNMHLTKERLRAEGDFDVSLGMGLLPRCFARVLGIHKSQTGCPVRLTIERREDREVWSREIGPHRLNTIQSIASDGALLERFGTLEFRFRVRLESRSLCFEQSGCSLKFARVRVPLPAWLAPRVRAVECADRFGVGVNVVVHIHAPLAGLVASYGGLISRVEAGS